MFVDLHPEFSIMKEHLWIILVKFCRKLANPASIVLCYSVDSQCCFCFLEIPALLYRRAILARCPLVSGICEWLSSRPKRNMCAQICLERRVDIGVDRVIRKAQLCGTLKELLLCPSAKKWWETNIYSAYALAYRTITMTARGARLTCNNFMCTYRPMVFVEGQFLYYYLWKTHQDRSLDFRVDWLYEKCILQKMILLYPSISIF